MSLFITSLNSGSNGNCYYIGNQHEAVLIDAGISCREVEKRMKRLHLNIKKVRGIFVSHEHTDHIKGIPVLSKKYQIPVFITDPTLKYCGPIEADLRKSFKADEAVRIGNLYVTPFSKFHDAIDPYSFTISFENINVGVYTDIGIPTEKLITQFRKCNAAFLEANYDEEMLENGSYPYPLKNRIRGGNGHLSNRQALNIFRENKSAIMSYLFLSHLSKNNNNPELVQQLFNACSDGVKIIVASRYEETPVYEIMNSGKSEAIIK